MPFEEQLNEIVQLLNSQAIPSIQRQGALGEVGARQNAARLGQSGVASSTLQRLAQVRQDRILQALNQNRLFGAQARLGETQAQAQQGRTLEQLTKQFEFARALQSDRISASAAQSKSANKFGALNALIGAGGQLGAQFFAGKAADKRLAGLLGPQGGGGARPPGIEGPLNFPGF